MDPPEHHRIRTLVAQAFTGRRVELPPGERRMVARVHRNADRAAPGKLNHHVAFGFGVHHCVGAPLARLELRVLLSTLVRRRPDLRLAISAADIEWRRGGLLRGVRSLPVTW
ncbi:cytochrome P450 [Amycolatopsis sp. cmx-4-68]|uniref:cytochrome P450 n=1 Tax=Amycolatopsis sp. cmx-4-68 TaxID=2790938 RepID=UPI00397C27BD